MFRPRWFWCPQAHVQQNTAVHSPKLFTMNYGVKHRLCINEVDESKWNCREDSIRYYRSSSWRGRIDEEVKNVIRIGQLNFVPQYERKHWEGIRRTVPHWKKATTSSFIYNKITLIPAIILIKVYHWEISMNSRWYGINLNNRNR